MNQTFECRGCGHCCLNLVDAFNGCVTDADLERWQRLGRADLLACVETLYLGPDNQLHTAWIDPASGDDVERCPWLLERIDPKGYICSINEIKPDHCRNYPEHHEHAVATGCKGYHADGKTHL
jgi:Fe-S-cluster containining protein